MSASTAERSRSAKATEVAARVTSHEWTDALRGAVVGASTLGAEKAQALLDLPDEQVGSMLKNGLRQILATLAGLDISFVTTGELESRATTPTKFRRGKDKHKGVDLGEFETEAQASRVALVESGDLLPASSMWATLDVSRQALSKAINDGRMFTVDVQATQYYPAFYLRPDIDRKTLAKVTRQLGKLPGWSKWHFFTTPKASLGGLTPLDALKHGDMEDVVAAAEAFARR